MLVTHNGEEASRRTLQQCISDTISVNPVERSGAEVAHCMSQPVDGNSQTDPGTPASFVALDWGLLGKSIILAQKLVGS